MGRREQKKQQTRERLQEAAYARFDNDGYDATKVEDVARDAGVSPRTVYRYFPTKADLAFSGSPTAEGALAELIAARPASERPYAALRNALLDFAPMLDTEVTAARGRIVAKNPTLYRYSLEVRDQIANAIGQALIQRKGPGASDAERRLLGHLGAAVLLVSSREWRDAGAQRETLCHYMNQTLQALAKMSV
jgi:AcrR family transcriptional regulator